MPRGTAGAFDIGEYRRGAERGGRVGRVGRRDVIRDVTLERPPDRSGGPRAAPAFAPAPSAAAGGGRRRYRPAGGEPVGGDRHRRPPTDDYADDDGAPQWLRHVTADARGIRRDGADPLPNVTAQRRRFIAAARPGAPGHAGVIASIRAKRGEAMAAAFAQSTRGMQLTAMRHFVEYSEVCGVDYRLFGAADDGRVPTPAQLGAEDEFLADFACYVVLYPRRPKTEGETNAGKTALSYVSHVRTWYELHLVPPRRPGSGFVWAQGDRLGAALRRTLDGLRKRHPAAGPPRRPIERHVMIKLARRLRRGGRWQRTKWAIYAVCWQGARRISECIRSAKVTGAWDPQRDMHRGRITATRDAEGRLLYFTIAIGPNKTDPDGTKDFHVHLPYSAEAEVNAAAALLDLFELDPTPVGRESSTPMYGDWRPGRSGGLISYATLRRELVDDLTAVGEPELAGHTHSFRRGAASALGGIGAPDSVTRMVGLWATDANLGYTWASTPIVRQKMLEMAEWDGRVDTARGPLVRRR